MNGAEIYTAPVADKCYVSNQHYANVSELQLRLKRDVENEKLVRFLFAQTKK